ncbi:MAG: hypothetical protein AAF891_10305 [Pseudomonadota bacterium]
MIKTFFFVEIIGLLGLVRLVTASRLSRLFAGLAVLFVILCIAAKYVPAVAGLTGTEPARYASQLINAGILQTGSGMAVPVIAAILFGASSLAPGRRWWGLDALFVLWCLGFFGLWGYTLL